MSVSIRLAKVEDIPQIQQVAIKSWHDTYEGIIPRDIRDKFLQKAYSHNMMQNRLQYSYVYVAILKNTVVGFANYSKVNEVGVSELAAIYLLPESQGNGVGTALLNKGIEDLPNVKEIHLDVEQENKMAMHFYQAKGFEVLQTYEEDFDGHILQSVRMCLLVDHP